MSPQPTRIIRRVPDTHAAASPAATAGGCQTCGAQIADPVRHAEFHAGIDTVMRWMRTVNVLLGVTPESDAQAREQLPTQDNTLAASGDTAEPEESHA